MIAVNQASALNLDILMLIEDNPNDVMLIRRTIGQINQAIHVDVRSNAEDALAYLKEAEKLPQLIILDLGLPRMSGREFLHEIKTYRRLRGIPIIILTGLVKDVITVFNEKVASGYIIKPLEKDEFKTILIQLGFNV